MSLGGRDDIYPAANAYVAPKPAFGRRNRYAEIMANYKQAQPFSFTGMPSTYTGGFNANPSTYTGGFTPYQRLVTPQPVLPVEGTTSATTGGGGAGGSNREAPSAWSQMTPAERAAYYAANPTEGSIALGMQDLLGNATLMGQIGKYFGIDGWYNSRLEKLGLNPEQFASGPPDPNFSSKAAEAARLEGQIAAVNAANEEGAGLLANPMGTDPAYAAKVIRDAQEAQAVSETNARIAQQEAQSQARAQAEAQAAQAAREQAGREAARQAEAQMAARVQAEAQAAQAAREQAGREAARQAEANAAAAAAAQAAAQNYSNEGRNYGGGGGGGNGNGGGGVATGGNNGDASGGGDRGTRGGFAQGGHVSLMDLQGPNPMGPDDGYGALKDGEYVINDKTVKKYGIELMNLINSGKISKGKLRGLLEM